ncbi:MAG TPA: alpha/beta fold hydrolase [Actinomycetota bacterium]|nr:alpha/beta fold hydrolase [Actinomycetota bacterium]
MGDVIARADPWVLLVVLVAAAFAFALSLLGLNWLFATRATKARLVKAGPIRRLWRWYRSLWLRVPLTFAGWPHVVDVLLRTRRAAVGSTPGEIVWRDGTASLFRFRGDVKHAEPVLIVHAVVSQPWILDLTPERSFVAALVAEGFDVFLLDWGDAGSKQAQRGLGSYVETLLRAETVVLKRSGGERLHHVGYCFGGTLSLMRAAAFPHEHVGSVALLAAPVDFAIPAGLQPLIAHRWFKPVYLLDGSGCVPAEAVRESFHALRPQAIRTTWNALRRRRDRAFRAAYDPIARWVWEHRRLPGQMFFDLVALFRTNALVAGTLELGGAVARLENVKAPVLVLIPERDHITPSGSSHVLSTRAGIDVTIVNAATGHVSMVAGSVARSTTWPEVARWLERHQSGGSA